jgi:1,4-dihydroxy-2-naphthoyl-CoA hydrolase
MAAEQEMMMTDGDTTGQQPQVLQTLAELPPAGAWLQAHGLMLSEMSGTRVTAYIDLGAQHLTPWGVVHGGVYTTAIETVASVGASLAVRERGEFAVGADQSADFLRSMKEGRVDIVAEPVIQGRVQQLWQVTITRHDDGKAIAVGRVRLQNVPLPPTA